jgi:asparagine synthase (glutamine-hydrolysing)
MCGVAGFLNFENNEQLAKKVNEIQFHRGPDAQNFQIEDNWLFCHQRLSVIDLDSRSNQPFTKDDLVIIYNGEIYNYREVKKKLESAGIKFRTESDTEVILELYRKDGPDCLKELRGMFVFAIYNRNNNTLFLARDPFGIKPCFFWTSKNKFAFASELKTLLVLPEVEINLNYEVLLSSVNFLWIPGNNSIIKSCHKLNPGHYLVYESSGRMEIRKYHDDQYQNTPRIVDKQEAIQLTSELVRNSVKYHMVSDVPVSSFLSGGLDSSIISVLAQQTNPNLFTYSMRVSKDDKRMERMPDDSYYANLMAQQFGFINHEIELNPDMVSLLPKIVYHLDEPIGDPAAINTYLMCEAARRQGIKVVLSGMGADEIYFGYRRHSAVLMAEKFKKLPTPFSSAFKYLASKLPLRTKGNRGIKWNRWVKRFYEFADLPFEEAYFRSYSYYDYSGLKDLFVDDISEFYSRMRQEHTEIFESKFADDRVNQLCNMDINYFMQGLNLTYTDKAAMAASVEVRVPFIDKEVIKAAMSIPGGIKYSNGISKYLLRKSFSNLLPMKIIHRSKASFGAPLRSWISGALKEMVDDYLSEEMVRRRGLFDPAKVTRIKELDRKGTHDYSYQIYQLLTIEIWHQTFVDKQITAI